MREKIEGYARRLEGLSIEELSQGAKKLVSRERRQTAALIAHLAEISRRKGHLELGFKSLSAYCRIHLGLGEYSVWNRTQVARVSRRFPQALEYLVEGKVSLSTLGVLAPHLSEENVERFLGQAAGKTKDEVKEIVAAVNPKDPLEPKIRRKPGSVEPASPELYNFRFSAGKSLKAKLERLAEVLGIEGAVRNMPEILEKALDLALEQKDPRRKLERRKKREAVRSKTRLDEVVSERRCETSQHEVHENSRCISSSVRERLLERAGYQCEYRGPDGTLCTARTRLEIDHIRPRGKGGSRGEENLRVFCKAHNLLAADREFGGDFMRGKIGRAKTPPTGQVSSLLTTSP